MANIYNPTVKLPIEGHTVWPNVMRLLVVGTFVSGLLLALVIILMIPPEQLSINPDRLLMGLTCVVIFEVIVVRLLIIPSNGDYGRFRINQTNVEYYPLSPLGLKVMPRAQTIPLTDFRGLMVQKALFRDGITRFHTVLVHPQASNSIRVRLFTDESEAKAYIDALAKQLSIPLM